MLEKKNAFFKLTNNKKKTFFNLIFSYTLLSIVDILILATVSILATYLIGGNVKYIDNKIYQYFTNPINIMAVATQNKNGAGVSMCAWCSSWPSLTFFGLLFSIK